MTAGGNSFKNATAHKANSYYTLDISYCTFCVGKHTILGPEIITWLSKHIEPARDADTSNYRLHATWPDKTFSCSHHNDTLLMAALRIIHRRNASWTTSLYPIQLKPVAQADRLTKYTNQAEETRQNLIHGNSRDAVLHKVICTKRTLKQNTTKLTALDKHCNEHKMSWQTIHELLDLIDQPTIQHSTKIVRFAFKLAKTGKQQRH